MLDVARVLADTGQQRHRRAPAPSDARDPARPRHGAPRRLRVGRRRRHARRGDRHRGRPARRARSPSSKARSSTASSTATSTAATCSCRPTAAWPCSTSGSRAVSTSRRRLAFLRLVMAASANDIPGQIAAMRDLGALPADVDIDAVIRDLGLDRPPDRPHHAHRRGAHRRDPQPHQGAPRLRGPHAQRAHALREGHALPRRRPGRDGAQRRRDRRDRQGRACTSTSATGTASPRRWASSPGTIPALDVAGIRASLGVDEDGRRHHLPRAPGAARADPAPPRAPPAGPAPAPASARA